MPKKNLEKRYKVFLSNLQEARERAGLSQIEAGQRLGRNQSFISRCESGRRAVTLMDLFQFADLYGVSINSLVE